MQKKIKKSCENVNILGWPPPQLWKFTTFFFWMNPSLSEFRLNINFSKTKPFQEPNPSDLPFPNFFLYFQKLSFIHSCLQTNLKESDPLISSENNSHIPLCSGWNKPQFCIHCLFGMLFPKMNFWRLSGLWPPKSSLWPPFIILSPFGGHT